MMRKVKLLGSFGLALALLAGGCRLGKVSRVEPVPPGKKIQLFAFVPCGLQGPFAEIAEAFGKANPGVEVLPKIENIDVLVERVVAGEDTDIFLSLGDVEVERMKKAARLLDDSITPFAYNSLAVIIPKENPGKINTIEDFANDSAGYISFADPERNSVGHYARLALQKAGLWEKVKNRTILPQQPAMVRNAVSDGRANAGIVYAPCLQEAGQPQKQNATFLGSVPQELYPQFPVVACVTKGSHNHEWGARFIKFLLEEESQSILNRWGFRPLAYQQLTGSKTPILVHSGAGIQPPVDQLAALFEKKFGVKVETSYKGSGCLLTDINFSHRGDVFIPGEKFYVDQCTERGFVTRHEVVAYMDAVIIAQKGNPKNIRSLQDLARPGMKVGLGNPEATAIGRISKAILNQAGIAQPVEQNTKAGGTQALTVQELGNAVKLRHLDAAIVWNSTAKLVSKDADIIPIPNEYPVRTEVPMGLLKFSKNPVAAEQFLELALSQEGQKVFADNGYIPAVER